MTLVGETWIADTWETGEHIAELESISVLPDHRCFGYRPTWRYLSRLHFIVRGHNSDSRTAKA